MSSAVVFGARNLGRAIVETLHADGWDVTAVARSEETLALAREAGALALPGDITESSSIEHVLQEALAAHGGVDLIVNAAAPYGGRRTGAFGGGQLIDAPPEAFDDWTAAPARAAFTFLSSAARFVLALGKPATLVQVTGGSARRAMPGRGLWAAGSAGVRAITHAAALELRERGVHVALLIVDAGIEPVGGGGREGVDRAALADPHQIAAAVRFLGEQGARAATHELQVTPLAEHWVP